MNEKIVKKVKRFKIFCKTDSVYLSKEKVQTLKGIFIIGVLIQQLYKHINIVGLSDFHYIGYICQAMFSVSMAGFVFLAGYELFIVYDCPGAIKTFGRNKLIPLYIINILLIFMYCSLNVMIKKSLSANLIVKSLTFGDTVIENGWFIQIQLLYYIVSYFILAFCKSKSWIYQVIALSVTYIIVCYTNGVSTVYYEYTLIFLIGMLCYKKCTILERWIAQKGFWIVCLGLFLITCLLSYFKVLISLRAVAYIFLILIVTIVIKKFDMRCKLVQFLGDISLEIYVIQGIFWDLFHSNIVNITNPYHYIVAVVSMSGFCACLFHRVVQFVYYLCGKNRFIIENYTNKFKKKNYKPDRSTADTLILLKWKECWDNGLKKKPEKREYIEFANFMEELWSWLNKKIESNRTKNFRYKRIYIVSFVVLSILYLIFFLSGISNEKGIISTIGENWAVFLTFPVFGFAVAKWIDVKKYQETWVRHYMQKALLEDEIYKYIYAMEPYGTDEAEEIFIRQFLKIKQANDLKFIENMETKEKSLMDMLDWIQKLAKI